MCDQKCGDCSKHKNEHRQWKHDFPIEWEKDHYVTRREMVKFLTLGSAFLVAANGVMAIAGKIAKPESFQRKSVALSSAVPENSSVLFRYPTEADPCIMVRTQEGALVAYSQVCTHLSCAVVHRADENVLFCPCHRGYFDIAEGRPTGGPPTRKLPRITLEQQGDVIFATGVEV
jgi:nitrite reductase/ring-hydroxylating ferredoxin subunit